MAWGENEAEGQVSKFNSAAFKMKRLHDRLDLISNLNGNLKAFNNEFQVHNFQLKFSMCEVVYLEVESKLNLKEREDGDTLRAAIRLALKRYPVFLESRSKIYPFRSIPKFNDLYLRIIEDWLFKYETLVRKLMDVHGMDTAYDDGDDGL